MKGKITREHTVWCALCDKHLQLAEPTKKYMAFAVKEFGWRFTKKYGWVCYEHKGHK